MKRLDREQVNRILITVIIALLAVIIITIALFIHILRIKGADSIEDFAEAVRMLAEGEEVRFDDEELYPQTEQDTTEGSISRYTSRKTTPASTTPTQLVISVDPDTEKIEHIFIEIFRSSDAAIDLINIPSDVTYLLSSSLYAELTAGNPRLSQSITLSEMYRYYGSDACYEAARRIVSEMINFNLLYFTVLYNEDLEHLVNLYTHAEGVDMSLAFTTQAALSDKYGTEGSAEGFLAYALGNVVTNWPLEDRMLFLPVYDTMNVEEVRFMDAPVIRYNESKEIDRGAMARMIYDIIY